MLRRLLRWGFRIATALSLVLFLLAGAACIRSQFAKDEWIWQNRYAPPDTIAKDGTTVWRFESKNRGLTVDRDGLVLSHLRFAEWGNSAPYRAYHLATMARLSGRAFSHSVDGPRCHSTPHRAWWAYIGPDWVRSGPLSDQSARGAVLVTSEYEGDAIWLPHWWTLAITGLLPTFWLWRWRRARRRWWAGRCGRCGYDLRGNPAAPICPECGVAHPQRGRAVFRRALLRRGFACGVRWSLRIAAAVSFAVLLGALLLRAAHAVHGEIEWAAGKDDFGPNTASSSGGIGIRTSDRNLHAWVWVRPDPTTAGGQSGSSAHFQWWSNQRDPGADEGVFGFTFRHHPGTVQWTRDGRMVFPGTCYLLWARWGALAVTTAILPLVWMLVALRGRAVGARRERLGQCPRCGYDLRGNPATVACPECGADLMGQAAGDRSVGCL